MKRINGTTKSDEGTVKDRATARLNYLTRPRRTAAGPDLGAMPMMTSRVFQLSSGDQVSVVLDVRVAPLAPRVPEPGAPASVLRRSHRVSVLVPTMPSPPVRVPFEADRFVEFEAALGGWTRGWSLRPGLTVGMWLSPTLGWVRDESRVYDITVTTRKEADLLTTKLYRHVSERFDQEHVLVTVTPEYSTLHVNNAAAN